MKRQILCKSTFNCGKEWWKLQCIYGLLSNSIATRIGKGPFTKICQLKAMVEGLVWQILKTLTNEVRGVLKMLKTVNRGVWRLIMHIIDKRNSLTFKQICYKLHDVSKSLTSLAFGVVVI